VLKHCQFTYLFLFELAGKSQIPLRYLVRSWFEAGSKLVAAEPDSVMEFGCNHIINAQMRLLNL